jgi:hypothetical protein
MTLNRNSFDLSPALCLIVLALGTSPTLAAGRGGGYSGGPSHASSSPAQTHIQTMGGSTNNMGRGSLYHAPVPGSTTLNRHSPAPTPTTPSTTAAAEAAALAASALPPPPVGQTPSFVLGPTQTDSVDTGLASNQNIDALGVLAPMTPPITTTILSSGGSLVPATTAANGTGNFATTTQGAGTAGTGTSAVPGTYTHPGGGGNTVADCMQLWDRTSHMTKADWKVACARTLNGIDLPAEGLGPGVAGSDVVRTREGTGMSTGR